MISTASRHWPRQCSPEGIPQRVPPEGNQPRVAPEGNPPPRVPPEGTSHGCRRREPATGVAGRNPPRVSEGTRHGCYWIVWTVSSGSGGSGCRPRNLDAVGGVMKVTTCRVTRDGNRTRSIGRAVEKPRWHSAPHITRCPDPRRIRRRTAWLRCAGTSVGTHSALLPCQRRCPRCSTSFRQHS